MRLRKNLSNESILIQGVQKRDRQFFQAGIPKPKQKEFASSIFFRLMYWGRTLCLLLRASALREMSGI